MGHFRRILILSTFLLIATGTTFAQRGHRYRPQGNDSSWSMRWHPRIGSHFGLADSCWKVFLSELPADTARILNSSLEDIRMNRAKIDTLHTEYRLALRADDTARARMIWVHITDLFGNIWDDWKTIKPIIREHRDLLIELHRDCSRPVVGSATGLRLTPVIPNPATTNAHCTYEITAPSSVLIQISDQGGNITKTVFDGNADAGEHEVRLDLSGMQSGAYLLRVQAGANVTTEKFVIRN